MPQNIAYNISFFGVTQHIYWENAPFFLLMIKYSGTHHNGITVNFFLTRKETNYMMKKKEKAPGLAKKDRKHWIDFEILNR